MDPSGLFAGTLTNANRGSSANHWLSASIGLFAHGLGLALIALTALAPPEETPPRVAAIALQLAPPPPPPLQQGSPAGVDSATLPSRSVSTATVPPVVAPGLSDEILSARFELGAGVEDGFPGRDDDGMRGGIPGGVVGGVPGGLVGGPIGGTGTAVTEFPKPDVGPRPIRMPQPSYTREAIRDNVSGVVVLRVVIDEQGKVKVLEVLRSIPALDAEAIRVVESEWRFHPATRQGRPVPALSDLVVRFNLY